MILLKALRCAKICVLMLLLSMPAGASDFLKHSDTLNQKRLNGFLIASGVGFTGTVVALDVLWYQDFPRSSFHFYNDNHHWKQMDKYGHAATAYWTGYHGMQALRWAGVDDRRAIWYGGMYGLPFLTAVEVLDGFSAEWGFSWGDQLANFAGSAMMISQELLWEEQLIQLKYSFYPSGLADYRPELLGSNLIEQSIKDYNGHTYWLSFPIHKTTKSSEVIPDWLNLAIGYSGDNMLGSVQNPQYINDTQLPQLTRYRQFYLSADVNWLKLETGNIWTDRLLNVVSMIKIPFPALEYNTLDGFRGHWLYF